jgi:uncharacterized membrane protein YbhN (UPF0104 family)
VKINIDKRIKLILKIVLTSGALIIVFRKINSNELLQVLLHAKVAFLLLAAFLFVISKILSSYRLNHFLRSENVIITQLDNLKLYWLGMYYNLFLPGGIGGDGYKIYLLNRTTKVKVRSLFWAILLDRITGLLALFCLTTVLGYALPLNSDYKTLIWIFIPFSVLLFYLFIRIFFPNYTSSFIITNIQSFGVQLLQLTSAFFLLKAIGIGDNYLLYLFVFLISSIVATIPFTIGGVGAREITFIVGAELLGLQMESSVGISFLFFFITAIVSLTGMYYSFRHPDILMQK